MIFCLLLILVECINYSRGSVPSGKQGEWYSVRYLDNAEGWLDLRGVRLTKSEVLSKLYISSSKRTLRHFRFPFYGEKLFEVAITTQGFLNMGSFTQRSYEAQYIAPLMANFKPFPADKPSQDIRDYQSKEKLVVQWSDMVLEKRPQGGVATDTIQGGVARFTFQAQLFYTGVIHLVYRDVPISPLKIDNSSHPVRVGMSGVYRTEEEEPYVEAHNTICVDFSKVRSNTTVVISPVPTCLEQLTCYDCIIFSSLCMWCDVLQRCSNEGQVHATWTRVGCNVNSTRQCFTTTPTPPYTYISTKHISERKENGTELGLSYEKQLNNSTGTVRDRYNITNPLPNEKRTSLPLVYVILITAFTLSALFVIAALVILKMYPKDHHVLQQVDTFSTAVQL